MRKQQVAPVCVYQGFRHEVGNWALQGYYAAVVVNLPRRHFGKTYRSSLEP